MGKQVTVTAKIPAELKETLNRFGVNVSRLMRQALELEAKRLEEERLRKLAEEAGEFSRRFPLKSLLRLFA